MNINPKTIFSLIKKELKAYYDHPTAYVVTIVFLVLWEFLFFRNVFLVGEASLRILVSYTPWLFMILVPAITMGGISGEKSEGTIEFILTHPVKIFELVIAKFVSSLLFVTTTLLFIFPVAIALNQYGNLDWGVVYGQFFASLLMGATFSSLGLAISSLFSSQISSLLVSVAANFFLVIMGFELVTQSLPNRLAILFERLSVLSHFDSMSRGVIDLRDVWYFLSAVAIFLSLTFIQILKLRIGNQKTIYRRYLTSIMLFVGIAILLNIVGSRIPGRLDLTQNQIYQITEVTKDTIKNLDDVVNIKLYASTELPAQMRPTLRDAKDILRDYELYGQGKIVLDIKNPSDNPQIAAEANAAGIQEVQFNVIGNEEFQVKKGYLGLAVMYGGNVEVIPIISKTSDLEYQLTSFIKKLTTKDKKVIGFLSGHGEKSTSNYQSFSNELSKLFDTQGVIFDAEKPELPDNIDALVIAGPNLDFNEEERKVVADYFNSGGSVMLLLDGANINENLLTATTNDKSLADYIESFGLTLGQDIVYDLRSNETVNFSGGRGVGFIVQYPFWPRVVAADTSSPITSRIPSIVLPWPSSLTVNQDKIDELGLQANKLYTTTRFGGHQVGNFSIQPDQRLLPNQTQDYTVAISLVGKDNSTDKKPRMIVVADSDFLNDNFVANNPENLAFGMESITWLSQEQSLAGIQLKQTEPRNLVFQDQTQQSMVKYGNLGLAIFLPLIIGAYRIIRRNNLKHYKYSSYHVK